MKTFLRLLFLLSLVPTLAGAQTNTPPEQGFSRVNAVTFAQGKSGALLSDLYVPQGNGPFPAILFIHGGGWIAGDRTHTLNKLIEWLASRGYVGMSIDYDLSPAVRFPVALTECKEAIRWLRAHAAEYHVDPQRIAVAGASAGGELSALVALTGGDSRYEGDGAYQEFSSAVKAGITYSADLDLTVFPQTDESILKYLGSSCSEQKDLCLQASPQFQIGKALPPMFVGHGNADHDVPYSQSTGFVAAYRKAHGDVTPFTAEGGPHSYSLDPRWFQQNADATLAFLRKHM